MAPPYVLCALICRHVVEDAEKGTFDIIDATNVLTSRGTAADGGRMRIAAYPQNVHLAIAIDFDSESHHEIGLRLIAPSGVVMHEEPTFGGAVGSTFRASVPIGGWATSESGRHWFEVLVDGTPLTRASAMIFVSPSRA